MWYYPAADLKSWDFLPQASGGGVVVLDGEVANVDELGASAAAKRWSGPNGARSPLFAASSHLSSSSSSSSSSLYCSHAPTPTLAF